VNDARARPGLATLAQQQPLATVVIQSLDPALFQLRVELDGREHTVYDDSGRRPLSWRSLAEVRAALQGLAIERLLLRHTSAYDEMIGHPPGSGNLLEVPLALPDTELPEPRSRPT